MGKHAPPIHFPMFDLLWSVFLGSALSCMYVGSKEPRKKRLAHTFPNYSWPAFSLLIPALASSGLFILWQPCEKWVGETKKMGV